MMKSYAVTMSDLRAETWIAHGTLLGWHWNQKFLPWDSDIDVQMGVETLAGLVFRNISEYRYPVAGEDRPRVYLLDINPHYTITSTRDVANKIDARWIDTTNGKYIDITAVHLSPGKTRHIPFEQGVLFCKITCISGLQSDELFPLQDASFEGISVKYRTTPIRFSPKSMGKNPPPIPASLASF
ncbi:mannosyltransferase [Exophiala xenobiotica]|nr:mannosyltransferase [Exophiala xenobiotica]KAK5528540.1 mannosyltransferase [Chaetothyriales sp. CCFEE 6169]